MGKLLWKPSEERIKNTQMYRFIQFVNKKHGKKFNEYTSLYEWSIQHTHEFWASMWEFAEIKSSRLYDQVVDNPNKMPGTKWFSGARLNFSENLLRYRDSHVAMVFQGEDHESRKVTYAELYDEVARLAKPLRDLGIKPGDRVVGFMPNMPETIFAMLAAASALHHLGTALTLA